MIFLKTNVKLNLIFYKEYKLHMKIIKKNCLNNFSEIILKNKKY